MILDHIAIVTKNLSRDVEWYTRKFNCSTSYLDDTWALLKFDNISLALVTEGEHPNHFAIVDPNVKTDEKAKKHRDGIFFKYESDPSGNVVEIIHKKST